MTGEHFQSCRGGDIPVKQDTAGKSELLLTSHCTKLIQVNSIVNEITTKLNLSVTRKITGPGLWVGGITYTNQSQHFFFNCIYRMFQLVLSSTCIQLSCDVA